MTAVGVTQVDIAPVIGLAPKALRKHFRDELDNSAMRANAKVAATMFQMATSGECPAMTAMWLKCRMHWKESTNIDVTGVTPTVDIRAVLMQVVEKLPEESRALVAREMLALEKVG